MMATLRVCWLFFSAFPVQRWLGGLGTALLAVAIGAALFGSEWRTAISLGLTAFAIFALFPAAVSAGGMLRALSAPHNHQLLPLFRVRALLATALLMVVLMTPLCLLFLGPAAPHGRLLPLEAVVIAFGMLSAMVLGMFVVTGQWNWMFPVLALFFVSSFWANSGGPQRLLAAGLSPAAVVGGAAASVWAIFVVWYLRVRRIRPPAAAPVGRSSRQTGPAEVPSRATAVRALMTRSIETSPTLGLWRAVGLGVAVGTAFCLLVYYLSVSKAPNAPPSRVFVLPFTAFLWPFVMMMAAAESVYRLVRQSRLLWLHVPGSRADVLHAVEATAAHRYLWMTAFSLSLLAVVLGVQGATLRETGWAVALGLSAALYGSYVGLAAVRGFGALIVGCAPVAIAQAALLGTSGAAITPALATAVAVQLLGAVVLRLLAARRWRSIDWLRFRPLRDFL